MSNDELACIYGGALVSTAILNTIIKFVSTSFEIGRALGSSIRRSLEHDKC